MDDRFYDNWGPIAEAVMPRLLIGVIVVIALGFVYWKFPAWYMVHHSDKNHEKMIVREIIQQNGLKLTDDLRALSGAGFSRNVEMASNRVSFSPDCQENCASLMARKCRKTVGGVPKSENVDSVSSFVSADKQAGLVNQRHPTEYCGWMDVENGKIITYRKIEGAKGRFSNVEVRVNFNENGYYLYATIAADTSGTVWDLIDLGSSDFFRRRYRNIDWFDLLESRARTESAALSVAMPVRAGN